MCNISPLNYHISLTNIGLYLSIGAFSALALILLVTNYNKVVSNSWYVSLVIHGLIIPITIVGSDLINSGVISNPLFIYYSCTFFYATWLGAVLFAYNNYDTVCKISFVVFYIILDFIKNNPFLFIIILISILAYISFYHLPLDGLLESSLSPEDMCNEQDVDPRHENRLNVVYHKLSRLGPGGDNYNKTMSSPNLVNGLTFTETDRATMHAQITEVYPHMLFKFRQVNNPAAFNLPNGITSEVLSLFRPTNP